MRKNKNLIFHIGTPKTGSTSIQQSLGKARDALPAYSIHYPIIEPSSNEPYNHIFTFIPIFIDNPENRYWFRRRLKPYEDKDRKVQKYRQAWIKEFKTCDQDHFIVSAEHLAVPYFNEDAVIRTKELVKPYFDKVTIIAYVRHYDEWITSQIQEYVKNGRDFYGQEELRKILNKFLECPPFLSYQQGLKKWIKVFGRDNIVVRPFDPRVFHKGSLLADFFHALGLPADDIKIPEIRSNVSIGKYAVTFLQHYNQMYPVFVGDSLNKDRGLSQEGIPVDVFKIEMDEKFKPEIIYSPEQAERFNEEIDFVNQFFTEGYQFERVSPGNGEMKFTSAEDIPIKFYVELVNNYNKRIEILQRRMQVFKTPLIIQTLNKFKFTKKLLRKLRGY